MDKKLMNALVTYAPRDNRMERVPVPEIGDDDILIKVEACSICAGDVKTMMHENIRVWGTSEKDRYIEAPVIQGHEFVGRVVEIGANVKGVEIGQRMVSEQIVPCGECRFCKEGNYGMCQRHWIYGFKKEVQGGFAQYMKFHSQGIHHKVPDKLTLEQAALIEPLACGMHAVERGNIKHCDVVVISGLGTIGQGMVSVARAKQPKLLIGLDLRQHRLDLGLKNGCDLVFNPMECDVVEKIKELTDGYGCDVYIEASGSNASVKQGFNALRYMGTFVQFGVFPREVTVDFNNIGDGKELNIFGSHLGPHCYEAVIKGIMNGTIKTDGLMSHTFKLSEWEQAFEVAEKDPDAMKVMLIPD